MMKSSIMITQNAISSMMILNIMNPETTNIVNGDLKYHQ